MSILKIRTYPDPVLKEPTKPVTDFDSPERQAFFDDMIETMYNDDGVGLAAPQVGVSLKVLIASPTMEPGEESVICNPEIIESSGKETSPEGCLSFPGVYAQVERATKIKLRYQDRDGNQKEEILKQFFARVVQHEMDHLTGTLLIDRVDFNQRQIILAEYKPTP